MIINIQIFQKVHIKLLDNYDSDFDNGNKGIVPYYFTKKNIDKMPIWKQVCYYVTDSVTPIYDNTYEILIISANNGYVAASLINSYDLIYCLNLYPGHHASYNQFGGYCYLNNGAICAKRYKQLNDNAKILILDIDYHAGNGTMDIFYEDPTIYTISVHADPKYDYPNECFEDEKGEKEGYGFNKNVIFPKKVNIEQYLEILDNMTDDIKKFDPELIIIPFGGDTYKEDKDPSKLYGANLNVDDYKKIGNKIKNLNKKIIITQEGGYDMENIDKILLSFIEGLL